MKNKNIVAGLAVVGAATLVAGTAIVIKKVLDAKTQPEEPILLDLDGDGVTDVILEDLDGDGKIDTVTADTNTDGNMDTVVADINGDGAVDVVYTENPELLGAVPEVPAEEEAPVEEAPAEEAPAEEVSE